MALVQLGDPIVYAARRVLLFPAIWRACVLLAVLGPGLIGMRLSLRASIAVVMVPFVVWIVFVLGRQAARRRHGPIVLDGAGGVLELPAGGWDAALRLVPIESLRSVTVAGSGALGRMMIDTTRGRYGMPMRELSGPTPVEGVRALMGAAGRAEPAVSRHAWAEVRGQVRPVVTWCFAGLITAVFVWTDWLGMSASQDSSLVMIDRGAFTPLLPATQWHRLVTASVMHLSWAHLLGNAAWLLVLGSVLERVAGWHRLLIVIGVGGVVSAVASSLVHRNGMVFAVGASGCVYAVAGALAVYAWRLRRVLPPGLCLSGWLWAVLAISTVAEVVVTLLPGVAASMPYRVDWVAHQAGFVAGAVVGLALLAGSVARPVAGGWAAAGAAVVCAAWLAGGVTGVLHASDAAALRADHEAIARHLLAYDANQPGVAGSFNNVAWLLALDPVGTPASLDLARALAQRAVAASAPGRGDASEAGPRTDTLAVIEYRRGELDSALARQLPLADQGGAYAAHAGLFLDRMLRERGMQVWGGGGEVLPRVGLQAGAFRFFVPAQPKGDPAEAGARVYAVVRSHGAYAGLVVFQVPPGFVGAFALPLPGRFGAPQTEPPDAIWTDPATEVLIALHDRRGCRCARAALGPFFTAADRGGPIPPVAGP